MKLMFHSNAPHVASGYGAQTELFSRLAVQDGHEVIVSAYYGLRGASLNLNGVLVLPGAMDGWGNDILPAHVAAQRPDAVIALMDVWVLEAQTLKTVPITAWAPIDHDPLPPAVEAGLKHAKHVWAMSRFAEREMKRIGLEPFYVPHGVDTDVFKPGDRAEARRRWGVPEGAFFAVTVASNKGWPSRKSLDRLLKAWGRFVETHPDAILYLHTQADHPSAIDLQRVAEFYKIPPTAIRFGDEYRLARGAFNTEAMAALYNAADVLVLPSAGGGFEIPLIEAQACFPAETQIEAKGIIRGMKRFYSGEMVTISTPHGSIEATANHPIWTRRGWKRAADIALDDEMLYTLNHNNEGKQHASEGFSEVYSGAIGNLVSGLQDNAFTRGGAVGGHELQLCDASIETGGRGQTLRADDAIKSGDFKRCAIGLHRWTDRRRRLNLGTQNAGWQSQAMHSNRQYNQTAYGLAGINFERSFNLYRSSEASAAKSAALLSISHRRINASSTIQGAAALLSHQTRAHGINDRVVRNSTRSDENGDVHREAAIHHGAYPNAQYTPVTQIERRQVTDLPVYNLTTESGTYTAGGYLVHNCGCPVITTKVTAMAELVGPGYGIEIDPFDGLAMTLQYSEQANVLPSQILAGLEWALARKDDAVLREDCRAFAMQYDARRVWREYMFPALDAATGATAREQARDARTAQRLALRKPEAEGVECEPVAI
jgi:glycosyltransferase involved in cell wall biosynthesis